MAVIDGLALLLLDPFRVGYFLPSGSPEARKNGSVDLISLIIVESPMGNKKIGGHVCFSLLLSLLNLLAQLGFLDHLMR